MSFDFRIPPPAAAPVRPAASSRATRTAGRAPAAAPSHDSGSDAVSLSGLSQALLSVSSDRIEHLQMEVEAGRYHVPAQVLSQRIIAFHLS